MSALEQFVVTLNEDPQCIVPDNFTNMTISGKVLVQPNGAIQVSSLTVLLLAKSRCKWQQGFGDKRTTAKSSDVIISTTQTLIGAEGLMPVMIGPGLQEYPFKMDINGERHLPSTLVGSSYGGIRYELCASLSRVGAEYDDKASIDLVVRNPILLNPTDQLVPLTAEHEQTGCAPCFGAGSIIVEATFNKVVLKLHSQDTIDVNIKVDNLTRKKLSLYACLQHRARFQTNKGFRRSVNRLFQAGPEPISPNSQDNMVKFTLGPLEGDQIGTINSTSNIALIYEVVISFDESDFVLVQPVTVGITASPEQGVEKKIVSDHM